MLNIRVLHGIYPGARPRRFQGRDVMSVGSSLELVDPGAVAAARILSAAGAVAGGVAPDPRRRRRILGKLQAAAATGASGSVQRIERHVPDRPARRWCASWSTIRARPAPSCPATCRSTGVAMCSAPPINLMPPIASSPSGCRAWSWRSTTPGTGDTGPRCGGGLEHAALRWLHQNAAELGVDRSRLAVGGESAGGGLAAALAQLARDRGEIPLCFQNLTYLMLDDRTAALVDRNPFTGRHLWTHEHNRIRLGARCWGQLREGPASRRMWPRRAPPICVGC